MMLDFKDGRKITISELSLPIPEYAPDHAFFEYLNLPLTAKKIFDKYQSRIESDMPEYEIINDQFVKIRCHTAQALEYEREGRIFDNTGRRIIYFITDTKKFSDPKSYNPENRAKQYIAFHGTGFDEKQ